MRKLKLLSIDVRLPDQPSHEFMHKIGKVKRTIRLASGGLDYIDRFSHRVGSDGLLVRRSQTARPSQYPTALPS